MTSSCLRNSARLQTWSTIYANEQMRWGPLASLSARLATEYIAPTQLPQGIVLDIGCGYGRDLPSLCRAFPHHRIWGIEGASTAEVLWEKLALANAANAPSDTSPAKIKICDIFALDSDFGFKDPFSLVFANYLFHLLDLAETSHLLRMLCCQMAKGALLAASFVSTNDLTFGSNKSIGLNRQRMDDGPWQYFDKDTVRDLLTDAGLEVSLLSEQIEIEQKRGAPDEVHFIFAIAKRP